LRSFSFSLGAAGRLFIVLGFILILIVILVFLFVFILFRVGLILKV
jgi:hypothetical protein